MRRMIAKEQMILEEGILITFHHAKRRQTIGDVQVKKGDTVLHQIANDDPGSGNAKVILEFEAGTDMKRALADVEREVKAISSFPKNSELPEIKLIIPYEQIGLVLINGETSELNLKKTAKALRDQLLDNGLDKIEIDGIRNQIIYVDLDPMFLLSNKLDPEYIANKIRQETNPM